MRHKSFAAMECPTARTLDQVGEWWSLLVVRDALHGLTRFDEFQQSMGISPNSLTRRLKELCDNGLLERRQYQDNPPRYEYHLTERGRDLQPVVEAIAAWGRKHVTLGKGAVRLVDVESGEPADPVLVDRNSGKEVTPANFRYTATEAAHSTKKARLPAW
jgi:DNA-binding HxlR family transcriptional regulator